MKFLSFLFGRRTAGPNALDLTERDARAAAFGLPLFGAETSPEKEVSE